MREKVLRSHLIQVTVNGEIYEVSVKSKKTLLDLLREDLDLTGTKKGCGNGECGTCTVLLNGQPVNACLVLAVEVDGKEILTIEGLADGSMLHPLQEAFVLYGAVQCGYCSPGMILTAKALLDENPQPSEGEVKKAIAGNLCRCGSYNKIVKAILSVAAKKRLPSGYGLIGSTMGASGRVSTGKNSRSCSSVFPNLDSE